MSTPASPWYTEAHEHSGSSIGFRYKTRLHSEKTPYQTIEIYDTTDWGKLMVIDGCMMVTTRDNFLYHEMMSHPVLLTHPNPKNVAIIGGGDCGTLREVLKHTQIEKAVQVEIDERVTRLAEHYFPELCTANNDPRAELLFVDGIRWMEECKPESLDIIIVDSTDPVGPAEGLFNVSFYKSCFKSLRKNGILVQQSESPLAHLELIQSMRTAMKSAGFLATQTLTFPQPCYPTGWWSCTMASKSNAFALFRDKATLAKPLESRYYNTDMHRAALAMPEFMRNALGV